MQRSQQDLATRAKKISELRTILASLEEEVQAIPGTSRTTNLARVLDKAAEKIKLPEEVLRAYSQDPKNVSRDRIADLIGMDTTN